MPEYSLYLSQPNGEKIDYFSFLFQENELDILFFKFCFLFFSFDFWENLLKNWIAKDFLI